MKSERLLESAHEVVVLRAMADEHIMGVSLRQRHFSLPRLELEVCGNDNSGSRDEA